VEAAQDTYATYKTPYGVLKVVQELKAAVILCSLNKAAAILANHGLKARYSQAFKYSSSSEAMTGVAYYILWRDFTAGEANAEWTTYPIFGLKIAESIWPRW